MIRTKRKFSIFNFQISICSPENFQYWNTLDRSLSNSPSMITRFLYSSESPNSYDSARTTQPVRLSRWEQWTTTLKCKPLPQKLSPKSMQPSTSKAHISPWCNCISLRLFASSSVWNGRWRRVPGRCPFPTALVRSRREMIPTMFGLRPMRIAAKRLRWARRLRRALAAVYSTRSSSSILWSLCLWTARSWFCDPRIRLCYFRSGTSSAVHSLNHKLIFINQRNHILCIVMPITIKLFKSSFWYSIRNWYS